jgi:hypothetical protein
MRNTGTLVSHIWQLAQALCILKFLGIAKCCMDILFTVEIVYDFFCLSFQQSCIYIYFLVIFNRPGVVKPVREREGVNPILNT